MPIISCTLDEPLIGNINNAHNKEWNTGITVPNGKVWNITKIYLTGNYEEYYTDSSNKQPVSNSKFGWGIDVYNDDDIFYECVYANNTQYIKTYLVGGTLNNWDCSYLKNHDFTGTIVFKLHYLQDTRPLVMVWYFGISGNYTINIEYSVKDQPSINYSNLNDFSFINPAKDNSIFYANNSGDLVATIYNPNNVSLIAWITNTTQGIYKRYSLYPKAVKGVLIPWNYNYADEENSHTCIIRLNSFSGNNITKTITLNKINTIDQKKIELNDILTLVNYINSLRQWRGEENITFTGNETPTKNNIINSDTYEKIDTTLMQIFDTHSNNEGIGYSPLKYKGEIKKSFYNDIIYLLGRNPVYTLGGAIERSTSNFCQFVYQYFYTINS